MSTLEPMLDRIDLSTKPHNTVAALIELLAPHTPHSLNILGIILNAGPRTSTLQNLDLSQISLWSTIPLHPDASSNTGPPTLFSIVVFSHLDHQFRFFCSAESSPAEGEETHVKQVFENLRKIAREGHPTYDSTLISLGSAPRNRVGTDPPMMIMGAVYTKWARLVAPMSTLQNPTVRYVFPRSGDLFAGPHDGLSLTANRRMGLRNIGDMEVEASKIREFDLPFVHGASSIPRSDAYILSRAPYSVCLRSQREIGPNGGAGKPVACALMHADGSIGALRVDPEYRRRGLGRLVIQVLMETLEFGKGADGPESTSTSGGYQDLGGGALGWNWADVSLHNEAGKYFFMSLVGKENIWMCHWTYMLVNPNP